MSPSAHSSKNSVTRPWLEGLGSATTWSNEREPLCSLSQLKQGLALLEQVYGPNHTCLADSLIRLALAFQSKEHYTQAQTLLERARAIFLHAYEPSHHRFID